MGTKLKDRALDTIKAALDEYQVAHPRAKITVYRLNHVSIRVRIIDPSFAGLSRSQREADLWVILKRLPEEVVSELSLLLFFTPAEAKKSLANMEFDDPTLPSL